MKKLSKNIVRTLMVIGAMVMLMCAPVSAKTASSVKTVKVGKTFTIKNTSKVTSSKKSVATAKKKNSNAWKISGLKKGKSTLKVYDKNGKLSQKVYLLVYNSNTFKYNTSAITLTKGSTKKVSASTNVSGVTVKYKSTNKNVAAVNSSGKITAKAKGTATIKAVFYYKGIKVKTMKKNVTVKATASTGSSSSSSSSKTSSSSSSKSSSSSGSSSKSSTGSSGSSSSSSGSSSSSSGSTSTFKYHTEGKNTRISEGDTMTFTIYCQYASDVVDFKTTNNCLRVIDIETGKCYDSTNKTDCYYHTATVYAYDDGSANVEIYLNGTLFDTFYEQINYNAEYDQEYLAYESWKADMKKVLWSDDINWSDDPEMRDLQKIAVFNTNVYNKFGYANGRSDRLCFAQGYAGDCWAYCDLAEDLAKDLGYEYKDIRTIDGYPTHYEAGIWINGHCYVVGYGCSYYISNFTYEDFKNYNGEYLTKHTDCSEIFKDLPDGIYKIYANM